MHFARLQISIILIFSALFCFSQEFKEDKTYGYEIATKDQIIRFRLLKKTPDKFHPQRNHIYHWYINDEIHKSNGGTGGKLLHGKYVSYNLDMSLNESGEFDIGQKCGKWIHWFPNGSIEQVSHWKNGLKQGKETTYSQDLLKWTISHYRRGRLQGMQKVFSDGKLLEKKKYKRGKEIVTPQKKAREVNKQMHSRKTGENNERKTSRQKKEKVEKSSKQRLSNFWKKLKDFFTPKKNEVEKKPK